MTENQPLKLRDLAGNHVQVPNGSNLPLIAIMDAKMLSIINNRVHRQKQSPNEFSQVPTTLPLEAFSFHISDN